MNEDQHKIDEIFSSAYRQFEEDPSSAAWEKITAGLDRKDIESYKKTSAVWKRMAIFLFLLLAGFLLDESGLLKKGILHHRQGLAAQQASGAGAAEKKSVQDGRSITKITHRPKDWQRTAQAGTRNRGTRIFSFAPQRSTPARYTMASASGPHWKQKAGSSASQGRGDNGLAHLQVNAPQPATAGATATEMASRSAAWQRSVAATGKSGISLSRSLAVPGARAFAWSFAAGETRTQKALRKKRPAFPPYWLLTAFASTDWTQYHLDDDLRNDGQQNGKQVIASRERHEPSFSSGIQLERQLTKHWRLTSGLIYSNTAIAIEPQKIYAVQDPAGGLSYKYITSSGYAYVKTGVGPAAIGDSLDASSSQHNLNYFSVPVLLSYRLAKGRWSVLPGAGLVVNFLSSAEVKTEVQDAWNNETITIRKLHRMHAVYLGIMASIQLGCRLSDRWAVNVVPVFKSAITPITKNNVVKTYPYSFGLGAGISYRL